MAGRTMAHTVDPFVFVAYTNDDAATEQQFKVHSSVATAMSFTPEARGAHDLVEGKERRKLRYIRAKNQASPGNFIQCPMPSLAAINALDVGTSTITWKDGATYLVLGKYGEVENTVDRR